MSRALEWIDVGDERARFCDIFRAGDECGRHAFAVTVAGTPFYGEMQPAGEGDAYVVEVVSFGYPAKESVGAPDGIAVFSDDDADVVERGVRTLVSTVSTRTGKYDRPSILHFVPDALVFRETWIRRRSASFENPPPR